MASKSTSAGAEKEKTKKVSEKEAKELVRDYFVKMNRPFSTTDPRKSPRLSLNLFAAPDAKSVSQNLKVVSGTPRSIARHARGPKTRANCAIRGKSWKN
jgi:hypothetical protein